MKLRSYQQEALDAIKQGFLNHRRLLAVLPTGAGKTILFAHLAASTPGRTLVLAHREELLNQAADKIQRATGLIAEIEKAEKVASMNAPVVVASVQTMIGRASRWPADHFNLVVVDEAHHALADSYQGVLSRFHDSAKVLGVTATPDRGDKRNLGRYFDEIAYEVGLPRLIKEGYLSRILIKRLPVDIDLRQVRRTAGDYNAQGVGEALEPHLGAVADSIQREAAGRKTIVFLPLVQIARDFSDLLRARGMDSKAVAGEDRPADRAATLDWFAEPGPKVLCNAMLLTEGFDQPDVDCIVVLRPTQVRALFVQMVGRGTRVHPGKEDMLLLDFLWQTEDHQIISAARLVSGHEEDVAAVEKLVAAAVSEDEAVDLLDAAEDVEEERLEKVKQLLRAARHKTPGTWDALELAFALNEEELLAYRPTLEWHEKEVTPAQAQALIRSGFDPESVTCRGHASKILDTLARRRSNQLATVKQVRILRRFGHPSPTLATFEEASAWISRQFQRA
jgi:superfamily II DNA or RNA helicase